MKRIGIIGCGWLGIRIIEGLKNIKFEITASSDKRKVEYDRLGLVPYLINFDVSSDLIPSILSTALVNTDAVIVAIPFSKRASLETLRQRTKNVLTFLEGYVGKVIVCSSIGIYLRPNGEINELESTDLHLGLLEVENQFLDHFQNITILRLAGLMGDDRYLSKYALEPNDEVVNHVHYSDIVRLIPILVDSSVGKLVYNVVAPEHPTKSAVIAREKKGEILAAASNPFGRIISSKKLEREFNFEFLESNPSYFKR